MKRIIAAITILIMLFSLSPSSDAVVSDKAEPLPDGSVPCNTSALSRERIAGLYRARQKARRTAVQEPPHPLREYLSIKYWVSPSIP